MRISKKTAASLCLGDAIPVAVRDVLSAGRMDGRVLSIAGSDSSGGAGIQADIKTITALGGYAMSAITAVTAQDTTGIHEIALIDPLMVERQVEVVLSDIGADAVKTGMLADHMTVELCARQLERRAQSLPIIVDPVLRSSSGKELLDVRGLEVMKRRLVPMSAVVTPNLDEAAALTGQRVEDEGDMHHAADLLLMMGASAVVITGGHLEGDRVVDLLRTADGLERRFEAERLETTSTHGTGCTMAAAIATCVAQGMTLESSVEKAIAFVRESMRAATRLGNGPSGPLDHAHVFRSAPAGTPVH